MKKITIVFLGILISLSGCNKNVEYSNNDVPEHTEQKTEINRNLEQYTNIARQSENQNLSFSTTLNEKQYFFFELGKIYNMPFYSSMAFMYYNYDYDVELIFNKVTEESITNTIEKTNELVLTKQKGTSLYVGEEIKVSIIPDILETTLTVGGTSSTSTTFCESVANSFSRTKQYIEQYSNGLSIKLPINEKNGFIKGRKYKVSFYETMKIYGVLEYDKSLDDGTTNKCFSHSLISFVDSADKTLFIEQSNENGDFIYNTNQDLIFDIENAVSKARARMYDVMPFWKTSSGTEKDPYLITKFDEFRYFIYSEFNAKNKYAKLQCDIDFKINDNSNATMPPLRAHLNCNNHKMSNNFIIEPYSVTKNGSTYCCLGMFATIEEDASISNLIIENVHIYKSYSSSTQIDYSNLNVGLICGINNGIIQNCSTSGVTTNGIIDLEFNCDEKIDINCGGICGVNEYLINQCFIDKINITIIGDNTESGSSTTSHPFSVYVGGLVGFAFKGEISESTISNIYFYGNSKTYHTMYKYHFGVLFGYISSSKCYSIENSFSLIAAQSSVTMTVYAIGDKSSYSVYNHVINHNGIE